MVDINIEILQLPFEEAKSELLELEDRGFIHVILVYPVLENGEYEFPEMIEKFQRLKGEVKNINLMLGNLIHYHSSMAHRLKQKHILTLNDTEYILLELPLDSKPQLLEEAIEYLSDYKVIIYKPHKCKYFNYKALVELKKLGARYLVSYEDTANRLVRKLLKKEMIDFIVAGVCDKVHIDKRILKKMSDKYSQEIVEANFKEIVYKA